jgi:hypothetical protein
MTEIDPVEAEEVLLAMYRDEAEYGDGGFFEHIGLPRDASWGQFRRHYDKAGLPDAERAANDLTTYPPVARVIRKRLH